jgi:hypothetical protein
MSNFLTPLVTKQVTVRLRPGLIIHVFAGVFLACSSSK